MRKLAIVLGLSSCLALASAASAVTRNVPGSYLTIQAAVTAAVSGDIILIAAGEYRENVTVPAGKSLNFTSVLPGQGCYTNTSVIVDGEPGGVRGTVFDIDSDGSTVQCMTIRHGVHGIDSTGLNTTVSKVKILDVDNNGILVVGSGFRLTDNVIHATGMEAVVATGNAGLIQNNQVQLARDGGYVVTGDNVQLLTNSAKNTGDGGGIRSIGNFAMVRGNAFDNSGDFGIAVFGNDAILQSNRVTNSLGGIYAGGDRTQFLQNTAENILSSGAIVGTGNNVIVRTNVVKAVSGYGVYVPGNFATIEGNTFQGVIYGLIAVGTSPVVRQNTIDRTALNGILVHCTGGCNLSRIESNTANNGAYEASGFSLNAADAGMFIGSNKANYNSLQGFMIDADGATITMNQATYNGSGRATPFSSGFEIYGDNNLATSNTASYNGDAGFYVEGLMNTLRLNTASYNNDDGFEVVGDSVVGPSGPGTITMDRNTANNNQGEGLENLDLSGIYTSNISRFNRKGGDCTNDGALLTNTGNICADGSNFVPPHQID